jgi:lipopolysaccharide transport system permease protein
VSSLATKLHSDEALPDEAAIHVNGTAAPGREPDLSLGLAPSRIPHVRICAQDRRPAIDFQELRRYHELLWTLTDRDIKLRYKQTVLGVVWVVLQPLVASLIFAFVFGIVAGLSSNGRPYVLFAFAGLTAWNTFANVVSRASNSLVSNAHIITKVYFPRLLLPFSAAAASLVDFAVSLAVMGLLMAVYRVWPGWPILLLPVWTGVLVLMGMGLSLMASALMVRYRDINYLVGVALQLGMYASPVAWSTGAVPEQYRWFVQINPLCGLVEAFRWSLLGQATLHAQWLAYSVVASVFVFWVGAIVFKRLENDFADVI